MAVDQRMLDLKWSPSAASSEPHAPRRTAADDPCRNERAKFRDRGKSYEARVGRKTSDVSGEISTRGRIVVADPKLFAARCERHDA